MLAAIVGEGLCVVWVLEGLCGGDGEPESGVGLAKSWRNRKCPKDYALNPKP